MNPVVSYNDFKEFLRRSNQNQLLPVILMKPSTLLYLNREYRLGHAFDYFDRRSGKDVQFFLPGYSHYPSTAFPELLSGFRAYNENAVALKLNRIKNVYYSDDDFIDFIELLENNSPGFRYYGSTELLFIKYIAGTDGALGEFDFTAIHRFNLSHMFYAHPDHERFYQIERFLEEVLHAMHSAQSDEELILLIERLSNE